MSKQLVAGLWGVSVPSGKEDFGLVHGQIAYAKDDPCIFRNAYWFNGLGQQVGFGDLAVSHLQRLRDELEEGSYFLVVSEDVGSKLRGECSLDDLANCAEMLVTKRAILHVVDTKVPLLRPLHQQHGLTLPVAYSSQLRVLLLECRALES